MNKFNGLSLDTEATEREKLRSLFPQCFSEDKLDIDKLLNLCGEYIDEDFEKYKFEWKGKAECFRIAGKRSTGTLRPCPDESVDWDSTGNVYIEGDNLEVLKLLQTAYFRKVKMIYIDPPYNTGNDFVYEDDFADPLVRYKEITEQTTKSNPESMGRFHTNWLNMMYPRLRLAANLLRDDGVIFISIDDNEVHNLRKICDEVFGEENFVALLPRVTKKAGKSTDEIAKNHDFILVYKKTWSAKFSLQSHTDDGFKYEDEFVETRGKYKLNQTLDYDSLQYSPSLDYPITINGETIYPGTSYEKYLERQSGKYARADWAWRWSKELFEYGYKNGFIVVKKYDNYSRIYTKTYQSAKIEKTNKGFEIIQIQRTKPLSSLEFIENQFSNDNAKKQLLSLFNVAPFDFSKPISLLSLLIKISTEITDNDIILDFFSGSATTAHAAMQLNAEDGGNRRFICVQIPELCDEKSEAFKAGYKTICEIGKERIRRAGKKIAETDKQATLDEKPPIDTGFRVFKLDTSNLAVWNSTPIEDDNLNVLWDRFHELEKTINPNRSDMDIIFEVMLKMGVPLDFPVTEVTVGERKCYSVGNGNSGDVATDCLLLVCLDKGITPEDVTAMCELAPAKIIAAEEAFEDDTALSNAHYILKDRDIEMKLL